MPEERLLYVTTTSSGISDGGTYSRLLKPVPSSAAPLSFSLGRNTPEYLYAYSDEDEIDLRAGTGAIEVFVGVTTASSGNTTCRVRATRCDRDGNAISSTDWTATQTMQASRTFTTPSVDWSGADADDRLRIDYEFNTTDHADSFAIVSGGTYPYVDTPFTNELDISVDAAGGGTTDPDPGTYDFVVAGKEVEIKAIPSGIEKKFVKWVIDSVDVFENPTTVAMDDDVVAVAHFDDADQYDLEISVEEGEGTVTPSAGTHEKYEQELVSIEAEADTEDYNAKIIIDSATKFDNEEFFGSAEFNMPDENVTVKIYFIEPFVRIERSDGDNESWNHIADVSDPYVENPADYLDTNGFQDDVEYFYRARRIEGNNKTDWSDEESIVYKEVDDGICIGKATGSGVGSSTAAAYVEIITQATATGVGTSSAIAFLTRTASASASGVGLATAVGSRAVIASANGAGIGSASSVGDVISPPVEAQAIGSGIGSAQASALNHVQSMIYGSGVGGTYPDALVKAIAGADASGIGSGTVDGIAQVEAKASGAGIGTSRSTVALFVSAKVEASGTGSASASADLNVIGSLAAFGIGNATAAGDIPFVDIRAFAAGAGVGSAEISALVEVLARIAGSGVGSGAADSFATAKARVASSGIGNGSADGAIIQIISASASASGVGLGKIIGLNEAHAAIAGSGVGYGQASTILTVLANITGAGVGSAQATTIVFLDGALAGSGIGTGAAVGDLPLVIITLPATDAVSNEARIHGRAIIPKGWWG